MTQNLPPPPSHMAFAGYLTNSGAGFGGRLPGYAFSDGVKKPGFGLKKMAETLNGLMRKLGYEHYGTQQSPKPSDILWK